MKTLLFKKQTWGALALSFTVGLVHTGCGSNSAATLAINGLNQIPSAKGIVNSSSSAIGRSVRGRSAALQSTSGTPPLLVDLSSSNVDQYFFNGVVAQINGSGWSGLSTDGKQSLANQFWGSTDGGPGGNGACFMAQSVGESIGRMLESATSLCYMKGIPTASGGVTMTPDLGADLFTQQAADRLVNVTITGGENQPEDVFIRVYGTSSVGSDVYKVRLHFCSEGAVTGSETIEVNRATGVMSASGKHSDDHGQGSNSMTGGLRLASDGTLEWDPNSTRTAAGAWTGDWGTYKGSLEILNGQLTAKRYNSWSQGENSGVDKNYSISSFSGSSLADVRFLEAAFQGINTWGAESHSYTGSTSYRDTYYMSVANDFTDTVAAYDVAGDAFFVNDIESPDYSDISCDEVGDVEVALDFNNSALIAVGEACEADRYDNYNLCWGETMQNAQNRIFQMYGDM